MPIIPELHPPHRPITQQASSCETSVASECLANVTPLHGATLRPLNAHRLLDRLAFDALRTLGPLDALALHTLRPLRTLDALTLNPLRPLRTLDALALHTLWAFRPLNALALYVLRPLGPLDALTLNPLRPLGPLNALSLHTLRPFRPLEALALHALRSLSPLHALALDPLRTLRPFDALWPLGTLGPLLALGFALAATRAGAHFAVASAALRIDRARQRNAGDTGNQEKLASHYNLLAQTRWVSTRQDRR